MTFLSASSYRSIVLAVLTFTAFIASPVNQVTDSRYSLLVSESILHHGTVHLDRYFEGRLRSRNKQAYPYQVGAIGQHVQYKYPVGSSILSLPFVALFNFSGLSATNRQGKYSPAGEVKMQRILAGLLMAATSVVFYRTALLILSGTWSFFLAFSATFATQIWSTASRALWSHTWGIFLLSLLVYWLLAAEHRKTTIRPVLFCTVLSWLYFVRPIFSIPILMISLYLFFSQRKIILPYLFTGLFWMALLLFYFQSVYGSWIPRYYQGSFVSFENFWIALGAHTISPSRGLLIYVPVVLTVVFGIIIFRRQLQHKPLLKLSSAVTAAHFIVISGSKYWWAGHCYGARMTTDLIPWFFLLAVLSVRGYLNSTNGARHIFRYAGILLLLWSIFVNGRGAISRQTWLWNSRPVPIGSHPERIWDWKDPQFLAGL